MSKSLSAYNSTMLVKTFFIFTGIIFVFVLGSEDLDVRNVLSNILEKVENLSEEIANVNAKVDKLTKEFNLSKSQGSEQHEVKRLLMSDPGYMHGLEEKVQQLTLNMADVTAQVTTIQSSKSGSGSTYVRWGRSDCPANISELVYNGYVGSSHNHDQGGASNRLCMTSEPELETTHHIHQFVHAPLVYGTEYYQSGEEYIRDYDDIPCAVCKSQRTAVVMIPGRRSCYPGWTTEYSGYIVAGDRTDEIASQYVCLDDKPQGVSHSSGAAGTAGYFEAAFTRCGALACPPYRDDNLVLCVICSK